jgi:hypothetical protein
MEVQKIGFARRAIKADGVGAGIVPIDPQSLNSFAYLFTWNKLHKFIRSGFGPFVKVSFHISFHAYVSMALIPFFSAKVE